MTAKIPLEDIVKAYNDGETATCIAKRYKVTKQTITKRLKAAGVTMRGKANTRAVTAEQLERMRTLRLEGWKHEAIALELGLGHSTVQAHLKAINNPHRPVLLEMLNILSEKHHRQLNALDLRESVGDRVARLQTIKTLKLRIAALESVI